jgi:hypothetical protein
LIQGRTDQGMVGDPNWQGPGRVPVAGTNEIYNFWKGTRGGRYYSHADTQRFAEQQQQRMREYDAQHAKRSIDILKTSAADNPDLSGMLSPQRTALPDPSRLVGGGGGLPAFRTENNEEVRKYVGFDNAIKNMNPEFRARVSAAYAAMPPDVQKSFVMNEGWRSTEYQAHLYDTRSGRGMVAAPGHSRHEFGEAIDVDKGLARDWLREHGGEYGIEPLAGDEPHFQLQRSYRGAPFLGRGGGRSPDVNILRVRPSTGEKGDEDLDRAAGKGRRPDEILDRAAGKGAALDRASNQRVDVNGTGNLTVDFKNMPQGVSAKAKGGGLFKDTSISTQKQMEIAHPSADDSVA